MPAAVVGQPLGVIGFADEPEPGAGGADPGVPPLASGEAEAAERAEYADWADGADP